MPISDDDLAFGCNPKWLMTLDEYVKTTLDFPDEELTPSSKEFRNTNVLATIIAHELSHAFQTPTLPLPIHEASAYYYKRMLAKANGWHLREYTNIWLFADLFSECVQELGDDLHKFMFGNLNDPTKEKSILAYLKAKFSEEKYKNYQLLEIMNQIMYIGKDIQRKK